MSKAISVLAICALQFFSQSANAQCHAQHRLQKVPHGYHQVMVMSSAHCGYNLPPARYATLSRSSAAWSQVSSLPVGIAAEPIWGYVADRVYPYGYGQPVYNGEPMIMEEPMPLMDPDIAEMPPQVPYNALLAEMPPNPFCSQSRTAASSGF
jgi:hypothetical protein